jgi:hypothetical protein
MQELFGLERPDQRVDRACVGEVRPVPADTLDHRRIGAPAHRVHLVTAVSKVGQGGAADETRSARDKDSRHGAAKSAKARSRSDTILPPAGGFGQSIAKAGSS